MNAIPVTYETIMPPLCCVCHDKPCTCKVELKVHPQVTIYPQICDSCRYLPEKEIRKAVL